MLDTVGNKYTTGMKSQKLEGGRTIGIWNVKTLRPVGKPEELTQELDRYRWNILGFCEMHWKLEWRKEHIRV